jgi:hypothetical protein
MTRRGTPTNRKRIKAISAPRTRAERPAVIHSSIYLPEAVYEALRKIAFDERLKIHDLVLEGIDAALRRRGYPSVEGREEAVKALQERRDTTRRCLNFALQFTAN